MQYFTFIPGNGRFLHNGIECSVQLNQLVGLSAQAKKHKRKLELALRDCTRARYALQRFSHKDLQNLLQKDIKIFQKHATEKDLEAAQFFLFGNNFQSCGFIPQTSCADLNFSIIMSCIKQDMKEKYLESSFSSIKKVDFEIKPFRFNKGDVEYLEHIRKIVVEVYEYFGVPLVGTIDTKEFEV